MYAHWISNAALIILFPCDAGVKYKLLGVEINILNILDIQNVGAYFKLFWQHHFWTGLPPGGT